MNILDENILSGQRHILENQRIRIRQIGHDISKKGIKDDAIIPFLLEQHRPTFFTRDIGFYNRKLCHARFCIVALAVSRYDSTLFIRRFLRYHEFNTHAKRMGAVVRVSSAGIQAWSLHVEKEIFLKWCA